MPPLASAGGRHWHISTLIAGTLSLPGVILSLYIVNLLTMELPLSEIGEMLVMTISVIGLVIAPVTFAYGAVSLNANRHCVMSQMDHKMGILISCVAIASTIVVFVASGLYFIAS